MKIDTRMAERIRAVLAHRNMSTAQLAEKLYYQDRNPFEALDAEPFNEFFIQRPLVALANALGLENPYDLKGTVEFLKIKLAAEEAAKLVQTVAAAPRKPNGFQRLIRFISGKTI